MSRFSILLAMLAGGDQAGYHFSAATFVKESELPAGPASKLPQVSVENLSIDSAPVTARNSDVIAEKLLRESFVAGDFAKADHLAKMQLADAELSDGYKAWLKTQVPMIRLGWAWALIRQKNCEEALPLLESTPDQSAQSLSLKGIGYCLLQKKDFAAAGTYLESYLERNKSDPEAYILLAEAKESQGEAQEALELAQQATALQNLTEEESRELQKRESSLNVKAEESQRQSEMTVGFVRLRYQGVEHQHLVAGSLQVMQKTMETLNLQLGLPYPAEPIEVIFHQSENFGRITHGPSWTAGLYDGRVRIPIPPQQVFDEDFAKVLRHEITHAVLAEHAQHRNLPPWFQEGLAQVAECPELCWRYHFAATSVPFLAPQSFDSGFTKLNRGDAQVAYKQSFYLMQVLYFQVTGMGIKQIIEQIPLTQDLSSDGLMQQVQWNFIALHQKAQENWLAQKSF